MTRQKETKQTISTYLKLLEAFLCPIGCNGSRCHGNLRLLPVIVGVNVGEDRLDVRVELQSGASTEIERKDSGLLSERGKLHNALDGWGTATCVTARPLYTASFYLLRYVYCGRSLYI